MDALQFAAKVSLSHLHNDISGVTGPHADGSVCVWLRNGNGVRLVMDGDETATVDPVRFTVPFDPDWSEVPEYRTVRYTQTNDGILTTERGVSASGVVRILELLEPLCRVQPLATSNR